MAVAGSNRPYRGYDNAPLLAASLHFRECGGIVRAPGRAGIAEPMRVSFPSDETAGAANGRSVSEGESSTGERRRRGSTPEPMRAPAMVELGHEPPLNPSGNAVTVDRRSVSLRWLAGSVLTGLSGILLIGAAIHISVEGDGIVAEQPQAAKALAPKRNSSGAARKGDKLVQTDVVGGARQTFRAPMTIRSGNREIIKVRPFVKIAAGLSLTSGVYATDIPPFNPQRFLSEDGGAPERTPEQPQADVGDADVSVVKRDLAAVTLEGTAVISDDEVATQIADERARQQAGRRTELPLPAQLLLTRRFSPETPSFGDVPGPAASVDQPFSALDVRVVPENVTMLAKPDAARAAMANTAVEIRPLQIKRGESFEQLLRAQGASDADIRSIVAAFGGQAKVNALPDGQGVRLYVGPSTDGGTRRIVRVMLYGETGIEAIAGANDDGRFAAVATPAANAGPQVARAGSSDDDEEDDDGEERGGRGVPLYQSIYETGLRYDLPRSSIDELIRVFAYDVDFQRRVSAGDTFEVFYTEDEEAGGRAEILSAALTIGGEARRIFRFVSPEDGSVDYFDGEGRSLKKFLLRKPIADGELRSTFGLRRHPILGYSKMHTGIDYANKIGTPIFAAGNGTVVKAGWTSGYGRHTEIQHANGYTTTYSHQSGFAKGVQPGARVRQGQVIGYVGNTGLSTGPHLHFEVLVNGHFVNPLKIKVPRGRELDGKALAEFKRQKDQVDGLIAKASAPRFALQGP